MQENRKKNVEGYFREAAASLLAACEGLDRQRLRSGRHLFPGRVTAAVDRLADLASRLGPGDLPAVRRAAAREAEALCERPLFVGGVHKSGTTLVRNLLDGHPEIVMLPVDGGFNLGFLRRLAACSVRERQRRLFKRMVEKTAGNVKGPLRWLYEPGAEGSLPILDLARWTRYFCTRFDSSPGGLLRVTAASFSAVLKDRLPGKKRYWSHKATLNVPAALQLKTFFPQARFLEIQRDSRAVYASQRGKVRVKGRPFRPYYELHCLHKWKRASRENRKAMDGAVYHVLSYEELVSRCGEVMNGVASFLGIEADRRLCEPSVAGIPVGSNTAYGSLHGRAGNVSTKSVQRWREVLDPAEIAMIDHFDSSPGGGLSALVDPVVSLRYLAKMRGFYRGVQEVETISPREALNILAMRRGMRALRPPAQEMPEILSNFSGSSSKGKRSR